MGHLALGTIDDRIEDAPGQDVQGADELIISADVPGHGTLHRRISCPLPTPGSGRGLVGHEVQFRHTTYDPDHSDDILVTRWPPVARRALAPVRHEGPGALRARIWSVLASCGFVVMWAGLALTPILSGGIVFGGDMFTDLPAWFHPGVALTVSISAIPVGLLLVTLCVRRKEAALTHTVERRGRR